MTHDRRAGILRSRFDAMISLTFLTHFYRTNIAGKNVRMLQWTPLFNYYKLFANKGAGEIK